MIVSLLPFAFAICFVILASIHLDLRVRHRRCKRTLERVARERDDALASQWAAAARAAPDAPGRPILIQGGN